MVSTALPGIDTYQKDPPRLTGNAMIFATSNDKYHYPEHKTPYLLVANFLNKGKYSLNRKCIEISDRYFYFLNADDQLEINFSKQGPLQTLLILFDEKFIADCFGYFSATGESLLDSPAIAAKSGLHLPGVPFEYNRATRENMARLLQPSLQREAFDDILFELLAGFWPLHTSTQQQVKKINAQKKSTREELYKRVFLAKELMSDAVFDNLSLEQIAREVCLDKFHFLSSFKTVFDTTPHRYYTELKLQKAFQLLQSGQYTVTDVCYRMGFESIGSFSNLFKKRFQLPPSRLGSQS